MKFIRDLLKKAAPTAAELTTALAGLPLAAAADRLHQAEAAYRDQLLSGENGADIVRTEREIADAKRECERLAVFGEELRGRIATATEQERLAALKARAMAAETEGAAISTLFNSRYDELVAELTDMYDRLKAAESEADATNQALRDGGVAIFVPGVEGRIKTRLSLVPGRHLHHHAKYAGLTGTPDQPFARG